jgi:hypothetical protein
MNTVQAGFLEEYYPNTSQDIELSITKKELPKPSFPPTIKKEIQASHIPPPPSDQVLLTLLQKLHEHPEIKKQLLETIDASDPIHGIAKDLLEPDLSTSMHLLKDQEWLTKRNKEFEEKTVENTWLVESKPSTSFQYYHLLTKPAQAIWWTGKKAYKVATVVTPILSPVITIVSLVQSPWLQIMILIIRKSLK